jgi:hypothetical protein
MKVPALFALLLLFCGVLMAGVFESARNLRVIEQMPCARNDRLGRVAEPDPARATEYRRSTQSEREVGRTSQGIYASRVANDQ